MPNQPEPGAPAGPSAITVDPDLWDLKAAPATLESAARSWRSLRDSGETADEIVTGAVRRVIGGGGWSGDTADSYDQHQRWATSAMADLGADASAIADALDEVAHLLRVNQDALDEQRDRLAEVPATRGTELTFNPEDSDQSQLVQEAIVAAAEIRLHVELQLLPHRTTFEDKLTRLSQLVDDWQPRTLRMVNLNIGQGHGNWFGDPDGTDPEDIGDIAQLIADQDADVATLQEVFEMEVGNLERELEARTGDEWTLHFGQADKTGYAAELSATTGFGNVVAVRHRGAIESSDMIANHDLNMPGGTLETPEGEVAGGQGRSAVEVEITFGGR